MGQKIRNECHLGNRLRQLRKASGYTQEQMVAKLQIAGLNISRSIYSQIECGTYNIRLSELKELVRILNIDYNTLFSDL